MTDKAAPTSATIVALNGDFDLSQQSRLIDAFATTNDDPLVIVDFSQTRFADSTVLSQLVRLHKDMEKRGAILVLLAPTTMIRRILTLTGLEQLFTIRHTLADVTHEYELSGAFRRIEIVTDNGDGGATDA